MPERTFPSFRFPHKKTDPELWNFWSKKCSRSLEPPKNAVLCSEHFTKTQMIEKEFQLVLRKSVVPVICYEVSISDSTFSMDLWCHFLHIFSSLSQCWTLQGNRLRNPLPKPKVVSVSVTTVHPERSVNFSHIVFPFAWSFDPNFSPPTADSSSTTIFVPFSRGKSQEGQKSEGFPQGVLLIGPFSVPYGFVHST